MGFLLINVVVVLFFYILGFFNKSLKNKFRGKILKKSNKFFG